MEGENFHMSHSSGRDRETPNVRVIKSHSSVRAMFDPLERNFGQGVRPQIDAAKKTDSLSLLQTNGTMLACIDRDAQVNHAL